MTHIGSGSRVGAALALVGVLAACSHSSNSSTTDSTSTVAAAPSTGVPAGSVSTTMPPQPPAATADTAKLTDANIIAMEEGGDSAEVQLATYAHDHASSSAVKNYATMLINDHSKSLKQTESVASALSITPQAPPSDTTSQETAHTLAHLQSLSGAAMDTAFVNHEVADHKSDIQDAHKMVDAAQQPRVKSLVQGTLPVLQKHLDRAEALSK